MNVQYLCALAEPTRLRIVELLRDQPCSVNEIAHRLHISQPQASRHLKYLAEAGIVAVYPIAQRRVYALNAEPLLQLNDWLKSFESYWNNKLNNLDGYLETLKEGKHMSIENDEVTGYKTLVLNRTFDAPRALVWQAWTDPEQFAKWWSPATFTTPVCELDVRPGGALRLEMRGPDGTKYPSVGTFNEVVKPELLSFINALLDDRGNKLFEVLHTVVFKENGNQTTLQVTSKVLTATPEAADYIDGMKPGLKQALDKLARVLRTKAKA
jgi:uncharacterized protein YndB with AHSA1/START domain/DNA-binding transcriptional ArsR family regulator